MTIKEFLTENIGKTTMLVADVKSGITRAPLTVNTSGQWAVGQYGFQVTHVSSFGYIDGPLGRIAYIVVL